MSRDNAHTSYGARLLPRRAVLFCHMSPAVCRHNCPSTCDGRCCPPIKQCVSMRALSEYAGRGVVLTKRANRAPYGVADARRVLLARRPEKSPGQGTLFPEARFTAKDSVESIARVWRISGPLCRGRSGSAASRVCPHPADSARADDDALSTRRPTMVAIGTFKRTHGLIRVLPLHCNLLRQHKSVYLRVTFEQVDYSQMIFFFTYAVARIHTTRVSR